MGHLSRACRYILDYPRRYPKTLAIRAVAVLFCAGYLWIIPAAKLVAACAAIVVILSYLITRICRFVGLEVSDYNNRLAVACWLPYSVFEIIWNLLSSRSEVDEI